ncbi:hypothetical protein ACX12E_23385 [Paenibacillus vandeheii]
MRPKCNAGSRQRQYAQQTIQTGIETDDKTEVLNGLKLGDIVVLP